MNRLLIFAVLLLLGAPQNGRAESLAVVVGGTVIDGTGAPPQPDRTILIEDGHIRAVGGNEVALPDEARAIDATGKWVIPGLIDAHVHFFQSGGLYTRPDVIDLRHRRPYEEELQRVREGIEETFARYIASGITAVIDMGGPMWTFELRETARGLARAPRVAVTGPLLGTMVPEELQGLPDPPILHIQTPQQARSQVSRLLAHAPDLVKIWFVSDASVSSETAWVRAAVEASHAIGVPVVAHATRRRAAAAMVAAGVDVLAHGVEDLRLPRPLMQRMAAQDVAYVTTLMVDEGYREVLGGAVDLSPIERRLGDPEAIASWAALAHPQPLRGPAVSEAEAANLRRLSDAGVTIAAGSDAGNIGTLHGPALHRELALMAAAGLPELQVLVAATAGGAKAMGREDELGTLEPGKRADLVILNADPLMDIRNTRRIHRVVKGGQVFHSQMSEP